MRWKSPCLVALLMVLTPRLGLAAGDCLAPAVTTPGTAATLQATLQTAQEAFLRGKPEDLACFRATLDGTDAQIAGLHEITPPPLVASYAASRGIRAYLDRKTDPTAIARMRAWFAVARAADPTATLETWKYPRGHEVQRTWEAMGTLQDTTCAVQVAPEGLVLVWDGTRSGVRCADRPAVLGVLRGEELVLSRLLASGEALPDLSPWKPAPVLAPASLPLSPSVPTPEPKPLGLKAGLISGGAMAVVGGLVGGLELRNFLVERKEGVLLDNEKDWGPQTEAYLQDATQDRATAGIGLGIGALGLVAGAGFGIALHVSR